MDSD
jgi:Ca2+-binding EF-hand superfamily protein